MVWLGRHHLAFAVANSVLNLRFAATLLDAAATAGSCNGGKHLCMSSPFPISYSSYRTHISYEFPISHWKARNVCMGCWGGPQYNRKCSFYFNYFFRTTPTNRDLREKAVYFPSRIGFLMYHWSHSQAILYYYLAYIIGHRFIFTVQCGNIFYFLTNLHCQSCHIMDSYWFYYQPQPGLEKVPISPWLVTLLLIMSYLFYTLEEERHNREIR